MRRIALLIGALILGATAVAAQTREPTLELRPFAGVSIPTGAQRGVFEIGPMLGVEGAVEITPSLHALATSSWTPEQNKYLVGASVNILDYNLGAEVGPVRPLPGSWLFMPFVGAGGGARTYIYSAPGMSDRTCAVGYGALGAEFKFGVTAMRVEVRDNVVRYRTPIAGYASTRNDLGLSFGLAYHLR